MPGVSGREQESYFVGFEADRFRNRRVLLQILVTFKPIRKCGLQDDGTSVYDISLS